MPVGIEGVEHKTRNGIIGKEGKAVDRRTSRNKSFHSESS